MHLLTIFYVSIEICCKCWYCWFTFYLWYSIKCLMHLLTIFM